MDKKYSDNEVRGERSSRPEQVEKKGLVLSFTKNAWEKYQQLTGSQKTFIDRELDDLIQEADAGVLLLFRAVR